MFRLYIVYEDGKKFYKFYDNEADMMAVVEYNEQHKDIKKIDIKRSA